MAGRDETYAFLEEFSTEQLEEMIRADLHNREGGQEELIDHILEVIAHRRQDSGESGGADRALESFYEHYNTPEGSSRSLYPCMEPAASTEQEPPDTHRTRHRRRTRFIWPVSIAACIVLIITPRVMGYENLFTLLGQWTDSILFFQEPNSTEDSEATTGTESLQTFATLEEAISAFGITEKVVPSCFPDGFTVQNVSGYEGLETGQIEIQALYTNAEGARITLFYTCGGTASLQIYEKADQEAEVYFQKGVAYYLFANAGENAAVWSVGELQCSIYTDISMDTLKKIIETI